MRPSLTALTPSSALLALPNLAAAPALSALQRQQMRTIAGHVAHIQDARV
jgi:hypothetical protein